MNFWSMPLAALSRFDLYAHVIHKPISSGIRFMVYLSCLSTFILWLAFNQRAVPEAQKFLDWAKTQMPILAITGEGLFMEEESPFTMVHPELGPLITFDFENDNVSVGDFQNVLVYVTPTTVLIKQANGGVEVYDLRDGLKRIAIQAQGQPLLLTPVSLQQFFDNARPTLTFLFALVLLVIAIAVRLLSGLLFAWCGLLLNRSPDVQLSYSQLYQISLYAMTPMVWIQSFRYLFPFLDKVPFISMLGVLVSGLYLLRAIRTLEGAATSSN